MKKLLLGFAAMAAFFVPFASRVHASEPSHVTASVNQYDIQVQERDGHSCSCLPPPD